MQHNLARDHPEALADLLPPLALDRQRIVQSAAFRRLQHKTQVFVAPESDHFRTRLTHTLEVAHQARCIAGVLSLNAELAEVVALAHDLGHPPFGHAGEQALDECLCEHGGFEHNRHTLRIVEELEHPYPTFRGLNLTRAVRACLAHHMTPFDAAGLHPLQQTEPPPESRVVDLADRLTYALHDVLDALYADLITVEQLADVPLWWLGYGDPPLHGPGSWRSHLRPAIDRIQRFVLEDLARHSSTADAPPAALSTKMEDQLAELERFLLERVYRSEPLRSADDHARRILATLFAIYCTFPDRLPERFRRRLRSEPTYQVVTDYVAGMTDRFCVQDLARWSESPDQA